MRVGLGYALVLLSTLGPSTFGQGCLQAQTHTSAGQAKTSAKAAQTQREQTQRDQAQMDRAQMDRDLMEITIPQLQAMYRSRRYTVTEVVEWYMARIAR